MLNPQQQAVIGHGSGPLLVIAGAGTGKTTVMVHRAAALVERGLDPNRLLLLTFTRKAAEELRHRVGTALKLDVPLPWCGTFHSIAAKLLRRFAGRMGLNPSFSILDEGDARDLLNHTADELVEGRSKENFPAKGLLMRLYSYHMNTQKSVAEVVDEIAPKFAPCGDQLAAVFAAYRERKRAADVMDFDDLLLGWLDLLRHPQADCAGLFDGIMVDEYQDTNVLQSRILLELCRHRQEITVVGDDAQAIYAFRGATVENILGFPGQFPAAVQLKLEENYRSTQEILDAANALWEEAGSGFRKELTAAQGHGRRPRLEVCRDDWEQAERAVGEILEAWQRDRVPLREMAVLFRSSHHSFRVEMELNKYRIPFKKFGGQRIADAAHVKDVLAFLRVHENPRDIPAWQRLFAMLPGVGPATAIKLAAKLAAAVEPATALAAAAFPKKAAAHQSVLVHLFARLFDAANPPPLRDEFELILGFYEPLLPLLYDLPEQRRQGVREIATAARKFTTRREFLDETMTGDDSTVKNQAREEDEYVTLSTIHSAKGLEWRRVFVLQLVEGGLPAGPAQEDAMKIDEERRLLYVAMTRAKEELVLFQPQRRETPDGQSGPYKPSRFLSPGVRAALEGGEALAHGHRGGYAVEAARRATAAATEEGGLVYDYEDNSWPPRPAAPRRPFRAPPRHRRDE